MVALLQSMRRTVLRVVKVNLVQGKTQMKAIEQLAVSQCFIISFLRIGRPGKKRNREHTKQEETSRRCLDSAAENISDASKQYFHNDLFLSE